MISLYINKTQVEKMNILVLRCKFEDAFEESMGKDGNPHVLSKH